MYQCHHSFYTKGGFLCVLPHWFKVFSFMQLHGKCNKAKGYIL